MLTVLVRSGVDVALAGSGKGVVRWPGCFSGVVVFDGGMRRVLADCLFNAFDDVRAAAAEVVIGVPGGGEGVEGLLERGVAGMNGSGRARNADGVARVVEAWWVFLERGEGRAGGGRVAGVEVGSGKGAAVVEWVLEVLEGYLEVARGDFQRAVRERPVHGLLGGLRLILERKDVYATGGAEWRKVHERVFRACKEIWEITRGVLCDDSPEGLLPEIAGEEEDEDVNTQTVMSYSWRAVKESRYFLTPRLRHEISLTHHTAHYWAQS